MEEKNVIHKFEIKPSYIKWSLGMSDIYNFVYLDFLDEEIFPEEKDRNVVNIFWNQETDAHVKHEILQNLKTHPKYEFYTNKHLENCLSMDWLNYSPTTDNRVADNVIEVEIGRKVPDEFRYSFKTESMGQATEHYKQVDKSIGLKKFINYAKSKFKC